jgi:hypothetical protein
VQAFHRNSKGAAKWPPFGKEPSSAIPFNEHLGRGPHIAMPKSDLPPELRKPIRIDQILTSVMRNRRTGSGPRNVREILAAELNRRLELMARYLGMEWPKNNNDWRKLLLAVCSRFKVPGFELAGRGPGAKTKWPIWRYAELLVDLALLREKHPTWSDHRACQYIAANAEKYDNRYPRNPKTLHRHFLRAKTNANQFDYENDLKDLIDQDVEFYEAAPRLLKKIVTQKSLLDKVRKKVTG